jgi:hypothetical protein
LFDIFHVIILSLKMLLPEICMLRETPQTLVQL